MSSMIASLSSAAEAVSSIANLAFGASGGVVLGGFVFNGFEVPEYITIGGAMAMTVHKLPGGERVIDTLGDDPADIAWSGTFLDGNPYRRVQDIEQMRAGGDALPLQWGPFFYTVVIRSFSAKTLYGRASYDIACTVVRNEATAPGATDPSLTDAVGGDVVSAIMAAPAAIAPALSAAQQAIGALGPLIPGSPKIALGIAQLVGVNASLGTLSASSGAAISAVSGASTLASATSSAGTMAQALQSAGFVGRAIRNLS